MYERRGLEIRREKEGGRERGPILCIFSYYVLSSCNNLVNRIVREGLQSVMYMDTKYYMYMYTCIRVHACACMCVSVCAV